MSAPPLDSGQNVSYKNWQEQQEGRPCRPAVGGSAVCVILSRSEAALGDGLGFIPVGKGMAEGVCLTQTTRKSRAELRSALAGAEALG